jgi:hypothetical protein
MVLNCAEDMDVCDNLYFALVTTATSFGEIPGMCKNKLINSRN